MNRYIQEDFDMGVTTWEEYNTLMDEEERLERLDEIYNREYEAMLRAENPSLYTWKRKVRIFIFRLFN